MVTRGSGLSYASEDRLEAERINFALIANGHDVFFDRADLRSGYEYDREISRNLDESDLLVFLTTPASVTPGRYSLTELKLAERKWPHPSGRVLPVLLHPTELGAIPSYVLAVSILEPRGDVAAEVAHAVEVMVRSRSPWRQALRVTKSPLGRFVALALVVALLVGTTIMVSRKTGGDGPTDSEHELLFKDPADRTRVRAVARTAEGFVVAMANPPELLRFSDTTGTRVAEGVPLRGQPVVVRSDGDQVMVATEAPDGVVVFSTSDWQVVIDAAFDPRSVAGAESLDVSGDIRSVMPFAGEVWAVTGDRDGDPTLLHLRVGRLWSAVSWASPPEFGAFDARGLVLRTIGGQLWGVTSLSSPARLYRIFGTMNVQTFSDQDMNMTRCATDLAESENQRLLLLDCDNSLLEIEADGHLSQVSTRATLPSESGPDRWTDHILIRDGAAVFVALNTEARDDSEPIRSTPSNRTRSRPLHARIARVDPSGVYTMLDMRDAVVTSLAVTSHRIVAVVRRADGSADAVSVPRAI